LTIELTTREDLINTLHLAAELEHNLMCQYLFAAYTMKRATSEGLNEVQLEKTRGWGALMTLVARQEMEHMGLALNLLSAIGGTPYFRRPNFPQRKNYYGQLGIKSELTPEKSCAHSCSRRKFLHHVVPARRRPPRRASSDARLNSLLCKTSTRVLRRASSR
jgi:hypothetical protein